MAPVLFLVGLQWNLFCHRSLFEQLPAVERMCELNTAATESAEVER